MQLIEELWKLDLPKLREQAQEAAARQSKSRRKRKRA